MAKFTTGVTQGVPDLRYPEEVGKAPFEKFIIFEARAGRHVGRTQVIPENASGMDRLLGSVGLYLSESALKDTLEVHYEDVQLGVFSGAVAEYLAQTGSNLFNTRFRSMDAAKSTITDLLKSIGPAVGNIIEGGVSGGADTVMEFLKADATKLIDSIPGVTPGTSAVISGQRANPRTDVVFSTQTYRQHHYDFLLVPRTLKEAKSIDRIINFFQFYMLPSYHGTETLNKVQVGSFMIGFPYEFEIILATAEANGGVATLDHVSRPGRSVLKNITIDHAAGGKTAFVKDGGDYYPVATRIGLQFQEVRLLARDSKEIERPGGITAGDAQKERQ